MLTEDFALLQVSNPADGIIRVGGIEGGDEEIVAGASGTVFKLLFTVNPTEPPNMEIPLGLQRLVDDLSSFTTSGGCILPGCPHDGDVNGDGVITPRDAPLAYEHYLALSVLDECEQDRADVESPVDPGSDITPADAQCILAKYLGMPSCLD